MKFEERGVVEIKDPSKELGINIFRFNGVRYITEDEFKIVRMML